MSKFKVTFHDKDEEPSYAYKEVGIYDSKEEAIEQAYDYIYDWEDGDLDGDSEEDVKFALAERDYYVLGYGDSDIEIIEL